MVVGCVFESEEMTGHSIRQRNAREHSASAPVVAHSFWFVLQTKP